MRLEAALIMDVREENVRLQFYSIVGLSARRKNLSRKAQNHFQQKS